MSEHTPGPWHERTQAIITLEDGHEETVTEVGSVTSDETICYVTDGKSDSLVIAAPCLLEACKDGLKFLESLPVTGNSFEIDNRRAFRKILNTAIAKAES